MKKIIINRCYGGFSISPLAEAELAKLKGKTLTYYVQERYVNEYPRQCVYVRKHMMK